jgi:hypothetical protein
VIVMDIKEILDVIAHYGEGQLFLRFKDGVWTAGIEAGREDDDSPEPGHCAYYQSVAASVALRCAKDAMAVWR